MNRLLLLSFYHAMAVVFFLSNPSLLMSFDQGERSENSVVIALCQTLCVDGDRKGNMTRIENALKQAANGGAQIACFPETAILGWVNPEAHELACAIPGGDTKALAAMAKKHGLWICCGLAS